jgi:hypothetical protein
LSKYNKDGGAHIAISLIFDFTFSLKTKRSEMKITNSTEKMTVPKNSFSVFSEPINSSTADNKTNRGILFNSKLWCECILSQVSVKSLKVNDKSLGRIRSRLYMNPEFQITSLIRKTVRIIDTVIQKMIINNILFLFLVKDE